MAKRPNHEGTIFKLKSGSWRAQVTVQGKRLSFSAKSKVECQEWIRKMNSQLDQGVQVLGLQITLKDYIQDWYSITRPSWRYCTAQQYEQIIRDYIVPRIGHIKLRDLSANTVDHYLAQFTEEGKSPRTVQIIHSTLHRALEEACRKRLIVFNPAHGAVLPKIPVKEMQVLDEIQIPQFLLAASSSIYSALYHLAITTGMRQGELLGLRWSDINWHRGTLLIQRQAKREGKDGIILRQPKTRSGVRTVKIGEGSLQALRKQKLYVDHLCEQTGQRWHDNNLIFPSPTGNPLDQSNLLKDFYITLERAGLPRIRFHDLRHTAASLMLNNNIPVLVASKMLGHSKPSTTLDIYGHLYIPAMDEAALLMDQLVTPVPVQMPPVYAQNSLTLPRE